MFTTWKKDYGGVRKSSWSALRCQVTSFRRVNTESCQPCRTEALAVRTAIEAPTEMVTTAEVETEEATVVAAVTAATENLSSECSLFSVTIKCS